MLLTLAVVLPTPHDYSGTFQEGTVPGLQPQGGLLREQEGLCILQTTVTGAPQGGVQLDSAVVSVPLSSFGILLSRIPFFAHGQYLLYRTVPTCRVSCSSLLASLLVSLSLFLFPLTC